MQIPACPACFHSDEVLQTGSKYACEYHHYIGEQSSVTASEDRICFWSCKRCGTVFETHGGHAHLNPVGSEGLPPDVELEG